MTREKAIEIIKCAFSSWESEYRFSVEEDWSEEYEACDMAIKALEQIQEWTPVSEPPKEHGQYLVTIKIKEDCSYVDKLSYSHNLYSIDRFDFAYEKRPGWYDYDSECGYYEVKNIVAWMPLPETYKAESEDKE